MSKVPSLILSSAPSLNVIPPFAASCLHHMTEIHRAYDDFSSYAVMLTIDECNRMILMQSLQVLLLLLW